MRCEPHAGGGGAPFAETDDSGVGLADVELSRPFGDFWFGGAQRGRFLVFDRGDPLGFVDLPTVDGRVSAHAVRAAAATVLADERVRAELRRAHEPPVAGEATNLPTLTAVVCTRGRPELLARCLATLVAQTHPGLSVLVVDNAPADDDTRLLVRSLPGVRYVREDRQGLDFARNRALAEAEAEWLAFLDDDAMADPGWAAAIARAARLSGGDAVTGPVVPAELRTRAQVLFEAHGGFGRGFRPRRVSRAGLARAHWLFAPGECGAGCNMAFSRRALLRAGGFDSRLDGGRRLPGGGDLDVFCRILREGGVLWYEPRALVRHLHRADERALRRQLYDWGRGYTAFLCANFVDRPRERVAVLRAALWWALRYQIANRLLARVRRGSGPRLGHVLLELAGGAMGPLAFWRAHRHVRRSAR